MPIVLPGRRKCLQGGRRKCYKKVVRSVVKKVVGAVFLVVLNCAHRKVTPSIYLSVLAPVALSFPTSPQLIFFPPSPPPPLAYLSLHILSSSSSSSSLLLHSSQPHHDFLIFCSLFHPPICNSSSQFSSTFNHLTSVIMEGRHQSNPPSRLDTSPTLELGRHHPLLLFHLISSHTIPSSRPSPFPWPYHRFHRVHRKSSALLTPSYRGSCCSRHRQWVRLFIADFRMLR